MTETPRRRDAAATRAAILASARRCFARSGYDGVGVREIAEGAGVTAMMVNRYFGSKERLLGEVIAGIMAEPTILTRANLESPDFAARIAALLVDITGADATPLDGFLIMLRSASSDQAAVIAREQIEAHYHRLLSEALPGDLAPQRAAIVLAIVSGIQVMRQVVALSALSDADPDQLKALLEPLFRQLLAPV
ncbi:TetR family transcriptional regulator [Asanoa ferruginea]|uniref:TetR family transcriptional regulator n=1 Tax=Asanoa ferruginea TaxID=53367 RepID=A0A3D9ZAN6_9ACTN|nr:TetR/AcrR family transcriptional regulator [Asanoa ferruginea]REF94391.1 TetR family transcriptional regulator [Asanoa ferruginea]GIF51091.1 TetR family transcriptional regulator [Asanoa ferruginea]